MPGGKPLTGGTDNQSDVLLAEYLRRNRKLQTLGWVSLAIPVALFITFSILAIREGRLSEALSDKIDSQQAQVDQLQKQIEAKQKQIEAQQKQITINQTAIGYVNQQSPGPRPKVVLFRGPTMEQVLPALRELGYNVEVKTALANPNIQELPVDTLEYGCGVTNEDIRTIAVALSGAGLPIRRIAQAVKNPDPHLVQLIASGKTSAMGLSPLTLPQIKAWSRPDKPCGS